MIRIGSRYQPTTVERRVGGAYECLHPQADPWTTDIVMGRPLVRGASSQLVLFRHSRRGLLERIASIFR